MTDHQLAFVRTLQPVLFGAVIGLIVALAFTYIPLPVIGVALAVGILIWFTAMVYKMNLDSVRRERNNQ